MTRDPQVSPDAPTVPDGPGRARRAEADEPALGPDALIGRYRLIEVLGRGGGGVVYRAHDPELRREVAIKVLAAGVTPAAQARLAREAQVLARLSHPAIVTVFDVGVAGDRVFVAMELCVGGTLRGWIGERRPWRAVVERMIAAGRGLAAAHGAGVVHCDVKPENVLCAGGDRVVVSDFGIARAPDEQDVGETDAIAGTPAYMAPEQHLGRTVDARADQFGFCVVLWEALYGERPFAPADDGLAASVSVGLAITDGRARPPPSGRRVPAAVRRVLRRGLAVDPAARFASMDGLLAALARSLVRRRQVVIAIAAALVIGAGGAALALRRGAAADPCLNGATLDDTWDAARAARVRAAFAATGAPFAIDSARRVVAALDQRAARWSAMRKDACVARDRGADSDALLQRRLDCLEQRRVELSALADRLTAGGADTARGAIRAADDLPALEICDDRDALLAGTAPPADPTTRARVGALRSVLAMADEAFDLGRVDDAFALVAPREADLDALGYAPLAAHAHYLLGNIRGQHSDVAGARRDLHAAVLSAADAHDDALASRAWSEMLFVLGDAKPDEAASVVEMAEVALHRAGDRPALRMTYLEGRGNLRRELGDLEGARGFGAEAVEVADKNPSIGRYRPLTNLALMELDLGHLDEALAHAAAAIGAAESEFGATHPYTAQAHIVHASILRQQRQLDAARAELEAAVPILDAAGGDRTNLGEALQALGNVASEQQDAAAAIRALERAAAITPPDSLRLASIAGSLGATYNASGDADRAQTWLERGLEIQDRLHHTESIVYAVSEYDLAMILPCKDGLARFQSADARVRRLAGAAHPMRPVMLMAIAQCQQELHDEAGAASTAGEAIALCDANACRPMVDVQVRAIEGDAMWATGGDRARARALVVRARALAAAAGIRDQVAELDRWLAAHTR